jgi:hypothetical protein
LALVGDRSVLIAKVPRAKVIDTNGKGSFHLEFPNLIIQPTLTETITSPILNILEPGENPFGNIATTNISESLDDSAPLPIFIPNNSDGEVIVSVKVG